MRRSTSQRLSTTRKQSTTRRYGDTPGFALVLSWLAQKWQRRCHTLAPRGSKNPEQYLTKKQKACLDSAAAELIRDNDPGPLNCPTYGRIREIGADARKSIGTISDSLSFWKKGCATPKVSA
jgi:hypothetical protein